MKKTLLSSFALASILFITGCSDKAEQINNPIINSKQSQTFTKILEKDCSEGMITNSVYHKLNSFNSSSFKDDSYIAEVNMCKLTSSLVYVDLTERININNQSFTNKEQKNLILQPCGKEKKIYIQNRAMSICKGADGFTRLTIELPSAVN